jgi:hypothetical protein
VTALSLIAGSGNPGLASSVAMFLQTPLVQTVVERFPDGESSSLGVHRSAGVASGPALGARPTLSIACRPASVAGSNLCRRRETWRISRLPSIEHPMLPLRPRDCEIAATQ